VADEPPQFIDPERHRDLAGRGSAPWMRRGLLLLIAGLLAAGLANVFGQRPDTSEAATPKARFKVYAPDAVRGGLFFEARLTIEALQELENATVVLDSDWLEGMTLNTVEPAPIGEASRDGDLVLELGHIPRGDRYLLFLQFQVNPTNVGWRSQDVTLYDGDERLVHVDRDIVVWP
jgi:hypothetical protein